MNLDRTAIYLTKSLKVIVPQGASGASHRAVSTAAKNLQSLGFGLSAPLLERLAALPPDAVAEWYTSVLPTLREMVGAHRSFTPMYPNFPGQVMEASEAELFFNAMVHYFGFVLSDMLGDPDLVILPNYEKQARPILEEFHELRWIDLGSEEDFDATFTRLAASNGSLSDTDKEILRWFAANRDVAHLVPENIPQKETLAFLLAALPQPECLVSAIKTATDVLRVAAAMSDGDVSLTEPTKFRSFSKRERRFLLECLENCGPNMIEDMLRWKPRWIRLGERLHPGDFKKRCPRALEAFDVLRNNKPFQTFNARAEEALKADQAQHTVGLLAQRPGDFARRLDHALRTHSDQEVILQGFLSVAAKVSTPVLVQAWRHFSTRDALDGRAFFPKGNAAKVQFKEAALPPLRKAIAEAAARDIRNILVDRFSRLPPLGKVYIAEALKDQIVPFSQRSASRSLRTIARGSEFALPEGNTVRFFCWWTNLDGNEERTGRVDIDLSASLFDADWQSKGDIAYYNLRQGLCYHSGDITSAPEGACEFIDINLPSVLEMDARYVVMSVLSFTGQRFVDLPECFGGWMMRQKPDSGEIFEARTVHDKIDISASTRACVPIIIDALKHTVYWADLGLKSQEQVNNAAHNSVGMSQIGRAIVNLNKATLHDLFLMHAQGRGVVVGKKEEADTVFDVHEGTVTAFDTDVLLSEYLA